MNRKFNDRQLFHDLQRLMPDLAKRYGVRRLGYFTDYSSPYNKPPSEVNIIVELKEPLGWSFFEMKEFMERRLMTRIDVVTPGGLKVLFRNQILESVKWL
jgi:predicted nucleotidyltransferase